MRRFALCTALLIGTCALPLSAENKEPADLPGTLARVAEYVSSYFARAQSIICDETVRLQSLGFDLLSDGSPARVVRSELRVSWEPAEGGGMTEPQVLRSVVSVNGRPPREKDRDNCFDPQATSPEALSLFLPENQADFTFAAAGLGKVNGRSAYLIDIRERRTGPITTAHKKEECFSIELPGRTGWRAWIDRETAAVLRLDEHLTGIFDVTIPGDRKGRTSSLNVIVERVDSSVVYRPVRFDDPDELLMLPTSRDTIAVIRNSGTPRMRTTQSFSNYRRFMTGGRIVQ